ncbi:hypothetical protein PC128_g8927 [Phytophthora cactorum]|nr:hypothetical protein PC120_g10019 [Phytophthora cactorum]KAG3073682.1 hypothetical protein PC121_g8569 [Phytophthora cactorum]KAG3194927.1 hypothetical protein PC128_g8927 [Phytophthora cactorum]KAG4054688.1 hypothetical protein PC123_g10196 [Phytophthora cactorum]
MLDLIERVWKPSVDGCKLLLLDSLKTHKMVSAWDAIPAKVIVNGFITLGLIPTGPLDRAGRCRIPQVVAGDSETE